MTPTNYCEKLMPEQRCCRWCGWAGLSPVAPPCWPSWASLASSAWTRSRLLSSSLHTFSMSTCRHASSLPPPPFQLSLKNTVSPPRLGGCAQQAVLRSKKRVWFRTATTTLNSFDIWSFLLAHLHHIFLHLFHTVQQKRSDHSRRAVQK